LALTLYPANKQLTDYPQIQGEFPFLLSINELTRPFPAHRHDFLECSLVLEGEGWEVVNGIRHEMSPGTFTFLLPFQVHELGVASGKALRLYNCMFDREWLTFGMNGGGLLGKLLFREEGGNAFVQLSEEETAEIAALFGSMEREVAENGRWSREMVRLKLSELLIRFDRFRGPRGIIRTGELPERGSVWPAIRHIQYHYREELTLAGLAKEFGFSIPYLSAEIKRKTGMNFLALLHSIRIQHACGLLLSTSLTGMDIAVEAGFNSYKAFMRNFRATMGMTPGEYRRENHEFRE
jgi:AraC-like DNA-binding protein